jgi:DNA primase
MTTHGSSNSLDDVKRRILNRVDLASLIGETVALTTRSGRPVGLCPFHNEKSGSFNVFDDGHYYCFGCKASGDAITFVREQQGMSYIEALRYLAGKFGVDAPELDDTRARYAKRQGEVSLYAMMADAQQYYKTALHDPGSAAAKDALDYLRGRGFSDDNIIAFGFGITPPEIYGLVKHLRGKGYKESDMVAASLAATSTRDGRVYDFLRARLTLPIADTQGRIIAFGGRTLDNNPAKYLNSRDSQLFDKSQTLFGWDKARKVIREKGRAIVVEGYMDALQLWQQGFPETVACLGTAFTEWHLKQLKNATSQVILLLDGDSAGQRATLASVATALSVPDVQVKAVALPASEDPDSFVRKQGAPALEDMLAKSVDLFDFAIGEKLRTTHQMAIPELVSSELVPWLAKIPDRIQVGYLVSKIAHRTGISTEALTSQLQPTGVGNAALSPDRKPRARAGAAADPLAPLPPLDRILFDLVGHLFHASPGELDPAQIRMALARDLEIDPDHGGLVEDMLATLEGGHSPVTADRTLWQSAIDPRIASVIDKLVASARSFHTDQRAALVNKLLQHAQAAKVKKSISTLRAELARLSASRGAGGENDNEIREILVSIQELTRTLVAAGA